MIRILHVQYLDAVGGTERINFTVLTGMDRTRFANELCVLGPGGAYRDAYAARGIPVRCLNHSVAGFVRLLRRGAYHLLFFYGARANLLGRLLAPLFSNAVRVEVRHGLEAGRGRLARLLERRTAGLIHHFVSNSHAAARAMVETEGKAADRIMVIQSGIDASEFARSRPASPSESLRVIAVGNLLPCKGHRLLIEAAGILRREGIQCTVSLAGDGPERRGLQKLAERLAAGCVRFLGCRSDVAELLADADVLVQPSLTEGLPTAVMEAMAAGIPVVATEVGGNGELVRDGETGRLVPAASPEALAEALRALAVSPVLRARMGQAGRERIQSHFPLRKMIAGFESFCERYAGPPRADVLFLTTTSMAVRYLARDKIDALAAAGLRVRVLCGDDEYAAGLRAEGLSVDTLKMSRFFRPLLDLRSLLELVRYLRRERPRIVHSSTPKAGLLGPLAARLAGIRSVHTVAGLLFHDRGRRLRNFLYRMAERLTAWSAGILLFQCREDLERIRRLGWKSPDRLLHLGNGIDLARFDPVPYRTRRRAIRAELGFGAEHFVVGLVARLLKAKGLREFLAAAESLRGFGALRFLVVGPPEKGHPDAVSEALLRRAASLGNVRFLGERQDMPAVYSAMDLFVLPSYREGIPRSLMEASAMELPVIASDIRGCREVVEPERTGWLVPAGNADALAQRILDCWRHPDRGRQMGRAGRERMLSHFDQRAVHQRLLRLYSQLLGQPAGDRSRARTFPAALRHPPPAMEP